MSLSPPPSMKKSLHHYHHNFYCRYPPGREVIAVLLIFIVLILYELLILLLLSLSTYFYLYTSSLASLILLILLLRQKWRNIKWSLPPSPSHSLQPDGGLAAFTPSRPLKYCHHTLLGRLSLQGSGESYVSKVHRIRSIGGREAAL